MCARVLVSEWEREREISCSQNYNETGKNKDTTSPYFEPTFVGNQSSSTFSFTVRIIELNLRQYFKTFTPAFASAKTKQQRWKWWMTNTKDVVFWTSSHDGSRKVDFYGERERRLPLLMQIHRTAQNKVK